MGTADARQPNRYLVGTDTSTARREARVMAASLHHTIDLGSAGTIVAGHFTDREIDLLRQRPDVRYVEPDRTAHAFGQTTPWGINRIDADVAHTTGTTGTGANIAIIDTGIDSDHPDLQANLGVGKAYVSCSGSNGSTCNQSWDDDNGHGTHCAGIAGAIDNTEGVVGVAPDATLHGVKVLDSTGNGYYSDIIAGIKWTADQGYDIGSMSLGGSAKSQALADACQYAADNGVLLVAAAGNSGPCSDCVKYPAKHSTVVAVSATAKDDTLANYSSAGPEVELAAPGSNIYSTVIGGYGYKSGTSMACPHVSGSAGLLMASGYTNAEARQTLQHTAEDIGLARSNQGYGLLDAEAAVARLGSEPPVSETGTVSAAQPDRSAWQTVSFERSYTDPVVVMEPVSYDGPNPVHVRLRNVESGRFEFQLEEWGYGNGGHTSETVSYLVVESGPATTADGSRIEVGRVSTNQTFTSVNFAQKFSTPPVVLTQAQTYNGSDAVVTRQQNVSAGSTEVRLQEEEARGKHRTEAVGYVAVEPGAPVIDGTRFEVGRTSDAVTDSWHELDFQRSHHRPEFFGSIQTFDGPDPAEVRYRNLTGSSVDVKVEEEQSKDTETTHTSEVVGYMVADPTPTVGETGTVSAGQPNRSTWRTVSLSDSYTNPVVVMNPVSNDGADPCHIRLRNVTASSFEFQLEEWSYEDGGHTSETVSYLVVEAGTYTSPEGTRLEAGSVETDEGFTNVGFSESFPEKPVMLTQAQTSNGPDPIVTRQRNASVEGMAVRVQEEEARGDHVTETVGYIAVEPGVGSFNGVAIEAGRTPNTVTDAWYELSFNRTYDSPQFLADIQTFDGVQPAELRYRDLSGSSVGLKVEEEQSKDTETNHMSETVGYVMIERNGQI